MQSEMLKRVMKAIPASEPGDLIDQNRELIAKAAIAAMREPIEVVCVTTVDRDAEYGGRFGGYGAFKGHKTGPECAAAISDMIDAALDTSPERSNDDE